MQTPNPLTDAEKRDAIVDVFVCAAQVGRALRLEREAREREQQKAKDADSMGIGAASLADDSAALTRSVTYG